MHPVRDATTVQGAYEGTRLRAESLAVTIAGRTIAELAAASLHDLATHLDRSRSDSSVQKPRRRAAPRIDTRTTLEPGHLSADRPTSTLSTGELPRLRLSTTTRSELSGVVFVLAEPTLGLHPAETEAPECCGRRSPSRVANPVFTNELSVTLPELEALAIAYMLAMAMMLIPVGHARRPASLAGLVGFTAVATGRDGGV